MIYSSCTVTSCILQFVRFTKLLEKCRREYGYQGCSSCWTCKDRVGDSWKKYKSNIRISIIWSGKPIVILGRILTSSLNQKLDSLDVSLTISCALQFFNGPAHRYVTPRARTAKAEYISKTAQHQSEVIQTSAKECFPVHPLNRNRRLNRKTSCATHQPMPHLTHEQHDR